MNSELQFLKDDIIKADLQERKSSLAIVQLKISELTAPADWIECAQAIKRETEKNIIYIKFTLKKIPGRVKLFRMNEEGKFLRFWEGNTIYDEATKEEIVRILVTGNKLNPQGNLIFVEALTAPRSVPRIDTFLRKMIILFKALETMGRNNIYIIIRENAHELRHVLGARYFDLRP